MQPATTTLLWQPLYLRELQQQLELLLAFCDNEQLVAGGMCEATADRLLTSQGDWNAAEMTAVMAVVEIDLPC
jgi:hypothetical protein